MRGLVRNGQLEIINAGWSMHDEACPIYEDMIDNMMKGSAGQAIHAANIALGLDETLGLSYRSLHPTGSP